MDGIIRRHGNGALDIEFYRGRAVTLRETERTRITHALLVGVCSITRASVVYFASLARSRCQPTAASGLESTEAK